MHVAVHDEHAPDIRDTVEINLATARVVAGRHQAASRLTA
jgi:hypothetical protein